MKTDKNGLIDSKDLFNELVEAKDFYRFKRTIKSILFKDLDFIEETGRSTGGRVPKLLKLTHIGAWRVVYYFVENNNERNKWIPILDRGDFVDFGILDEKIIFQTWNSRVVKTNELHEILDVEENETPFFYELFDFIMSKTKSIKKTIKIINNCEDWITKKVTSSTEGNVKTEVSEISIEISNVLQIIEDIN